MINSFDAVNFSASVDFIRSNQQYIAMYSQYTTLYCILENIITGEQVGFRITFERTELGFLSGLPHDVTSMQVNIFTLVSGLMRFSTWYDCLQAEACVWSVMTSQYCFFFLGFRGNLHGMYADCSST